MAIALSTIGKFIIKKKVGEEDRIFGRCVSSPLYVRKCHLLLLTPVNINLPMVSDCTGICSCSVTTAEIVDAIFQQTGRELNKKDIELPEITSLGTFPATIRLHPEVIGTFNVVVQREKNA
jgi:large subunit ribosomal protein L9